MNWLRLWGFLLALSIGGVLQSYGAASRAFLWVTLSGFAMLALIVDFWRTTRPYREEQRRQIKAVDDARIEEAARRIIKEHHETLRRLAADD